MPAITGDSFVCCPTCDAMYAYNGSKPDPDKVAQNCTVHNRDDFTIDERASYAIYMGWDSYREYFDEEGRRPAK